MYFVLNKNKYSECQLILGHKMNDNFIRTLAKIEAHMDYTHNMLKNMNKNLHELDQRLRNLERAYDKWQGILALLFGAGSIIGILIPQGIQWLFKNI